MKNLHFVVVLLSLLLFISCSKGKNNDQDSSLPIIDLEKALKNLTNKKFDFSNFASDITYIPLETNDHSIFGGKWAPPCNITENYLFMGDMMFKRDGSFVRKIGKIGQGPEEYILARGIAADEKRQEFYIYDNPTHNIVIYGFDNVFKKRVKVHFLGHFIYSLGDGKLLMKRRRGCIFDDFYEYQIIDSDQEKIVYTRNTGIIKDGNNEKGCAFGLGKNIIWSFENTTSYYEFFSDTIFSLKDGIVDTPLYQINVGKNKYTVDVMHDTEDSEYRPELYMHIVSIAESSQYLFVDIFYGNKSYTVIYNKKSRELLANETNEFFNNDIDGGFVWLFKNIKGETIGHYSFLPYIGKDRIEELSKTNKGYDEEKNAALKNLINHIDEDDNEVIYFFNLK